MSRPSYARMSPSSDNGMGGSVYSTSAYISGPRSPSSGAFEIGGDGRIQPESMDFDEIESVMWRKVSFTQNHLPKQRIIGQPTPLYFNAILAPTSPFLPRSRAGLDVYTPHDGVEVASCHRDRSARGFVRCLRSNSHRRPD
jgi:hypothetical protein